MTKIANVLSISGGKDSTAMWILAVREMGTEVIPVFADTGNESPITYEYIDYLESKLGPIRRVKADFSEQIAQKRKYVAEHWPEKLMQSGKTKEEAEYIVERTLIIFTRPETRFLICAFGRGGFLRRKQGSARNILRSFRLLSKYISRFLRRDTRS